MANKLHRAKPFFKQYLELKGVLPDIMYDISAKGYPKVKITRSESQFQDQDMFTTKPIIFKVDSNKKAAEIMHFFETDKYLCEFIPAETCKRVKPISIEYTKDNTTMHIIFRLTRIGASYLISIQGETEEEMFELTKLVQAKLKELGIMYERKCRWVCFT